MTSTPSPLPSTPVSTSISSPTYSCSINHISTPNGDIVFNSDPMNPGMFIPVSDQHTIDAYCDSRPSYNEQYPGGCRNFIRNDNMLNFITKEAPVFGKEFTNIAIEKLRICQSAELPAYLKWRASQQDVDNSQTQNVASVCNL